MERIPPEVWGAVFGNLLNSLDFQNAYKTCQLWRDVLQPSRSSWIFGLVFTHLEKYLSVNDAFRCRSVCKHWLHGVNNYLLNHTRLRPTFKEPGAPDNLNKLDERLDLEYYPSGILSTVVEVCDLQRDEMIDKVSNYSSSLPLLGRWFQIHVTPDEPQSELIENFLVSFGSYIWFLTVSIREGPDALAVLDYLLECLPLFPNLKWLKVEFELSYPFTLPVHQRRQYLNNHLETVSVLERIEKLPKFLEFLELDYTFRDGKDHEFKKVLFEMMISSGRNLQSVALGEITDLASLETGSIVDLSVTLESYAAVKQICKVRSPVTRLKLGCDDDIVPTEALFRVARHFRETLRNFHLELNYRVHEYRVGCENSMNKRCFFVEPLTDREALKDLKNVKRMSIEGSCFLSLNFLCGLSSNLEYLHLMITFDSEEDERIFEPFLQRMEFTEEMDLLEGLKQFVRVRDRQIIYGLNFWKVFPRLREMTFELWSDGRKEFRFRRDVFDKFNQNL